MTPGLIVSVWKKQYLYLKTKKHQNNKTLYSYYLNYKNNFTKILRLTKTNFYKNKFNSIASNPKLTWILIKVITNTNNAHLKEISSISVNNNIIYAKNEPYKVSNIFNTFFIEIGQKIAEKNIKHDNFRNEDVQYYDNLLLITCIMNK